MTGEEEALQRDSTNGAVRDTSSRRDLYRYLTVDSGEVAQEYVAIMRLFTGTLLADLSAAEVAAQLESGPLVDLDTVENRCEQLVT